MPAGLLSDPVRARWAGWLLVALLSWVALILRMALDFDGVLDTDVMNFGLAAFEFDVTRHQPHPPGYPGYVVFLKLIHALAPGLDPIAVAKWGTRICGVLTVPAAYWATGQVLGGRGEAGITRPLAAAGLAVIHPILWFYGGDGQSHAAEALATLLLFGASAWVVRRPGLGLRLLLVAAFGLSGSIRPTIPLLASPLLVWVMWGQPLRRWGMAVAVGVASVVAWYVPLVLAAGGLELYSRVTRALVTELFIENFSVFGERSTWRTIVSNLVLTAYSALLASIPFVALRASDVRPWLRAALAIVAANLLFFALVFTSEPGYLSGVAAVSCLVPATWRSPAPTFTRVRFGLAGALSLGLVWFGPASIPLPYAPGIFVPSFAHVVEVKEAQEYHRGLICGVAEGKRALVVTDNPVTTHNRWLPMACPNVIVAVYLHDFPFRDDLDNWLIFEADTMHAVPPPVPNEPGPPAEHTLPPVEVIIVTPGTSDDWRRELEAATACEPLRIAGDDLGEDMAVLAWPARCFDAFRFGAHTLHVRR